MPDQPESAPRRHAPERTDAATPDPKFVGAAGDCGCGCGVFEGSYGVIGAVDKLIPVDRHIPGGPSKPQALLAGLIALMTRPRPVAPPAH